MAKHLPQIKVREIRLVLVCFTFLGAALYFTFLSQVNEDMGTVDAYDAGERAALQWLSSKLQSRPHAKEYEVRWSVKPALPRGERLIMRYERGRKLLAVRACAGDDRVDYLSWTNLSSDEVHSAAKKNGTFKSFAQSGHKPYLDGSFYVFQR